MKTLGVTPNSTVLSNYCKYLDGRMDKLEGLISGGEPFRILEGEVYLPRLGKHWLNVVTGQYYALDSDGKLIFDRKD